MDSKTERIETEKSSVKFDRDTVKETIINFLLQCARLYGHVPTEMTLPKPLAERLLAEVFLIKTDEGIFPDGDFKMAHAAKPS